MEKMDRRVRKTRALLLQGLVKMMENHDIQDDDIYDMLHKVEDEMFRELVQRDHGAGTARYSHIVL